jgi:thioredoxin-like negative regulator of GroEL
MRFSFTVVAIAVLLLLVHGQKPEKPYRGPSEADVIELSPSNFEDTVYSSEEPWLIELYAPWCEHCRTLRPEWAQLATSLKGRVTVAKIDPSDNAYRPKFHKLVGFPRIVMLPAGTSC